MLCFVHICVYVCLQIDVQTHICVYLYLGILHVDSMTKM